MDAQTAVELVGKYISIWNTAEKRSRQSLIESTFTPDAVYVDPNVTATGTTEIGKYIGDASWNFVGMHFTHGTVLTHHDLVHFTWQVGPIGGPPAVSGYDVALFEGGGITRLYGFFNGH
ncbi:nuclear transport factor 2 family protein [Nocardiopsis rhodophaea]|uniref:nuclear transport factor 2 family protein n=1 Tax=Nocardiopsis rhodophaea TaxID=280238 RepID=UPI0031D1DB01